jgi:hypothetical protein
MFDQQQLSDLNQTLQPFVQSDSLSVFEELTISRRNEKLGDILYIRLYGSKNLPADNNQAEALAKKVCNALFPQIPSPRKYSLWKIQFAAKHAEKETRLLKVFNFVPSELNNP